MLIVQYDQLSDQEADKEAYECQVRPLFKEIAWASVHVNAQKDLRCCLAYIEAHGGMVSPRVSLVVVSDLWNPESAGGNQEDCCVVEEDVLLCEVNNESKVDA